jgi:hypothetical protein
MLLEHSGQIKLVAMMLILQTSTASVLGRNVGREVTAIPHVTIQDNNVRVSHSDTAAHGSLAGSFAARVIMPASSVGERSSAMKRTEPSAQDTFTPPR